ncbi:MAG: bifunctional glycosyltransferase family 2/GtrA family protein [bacterium]|nr:bifunctional glycosyltransferase family 2/GtrA family protein [bacterium]
MANKSPDTNYVVLIPAYQPGQSLIESTNKLIAAGGYEVVVVDDGGGLDYQPVFDQLDKKIHFIQHEVNQGKGAALKTGYNYIDANFKNYIIITADADGQHHITDIKKVAQAYHKHPGTLLLGSRTFEDREIPLRSRFGNVLTRKIFSLITNQEVRDTQTGLRAFDDSLTKFMIDIPGERFEYEMDVLLACSSQGVKIVELPIKTIYENNNETSHFNPIKDSISIYGQIIKFASSSLMSFGLDYVMFLALLHLTGHWHLAASVALANIGARLISASVNFAINKRLVFQHKGNLLKGLLSYAALAACILVANTILLTILTSTLGIAPYIAKIMTEVVLFFASYFVQKNLIFKRQHEVTD